MYKITLSSELNENRYGVQFKRGVGMTDDKRIAEICRSKGFSVEDSEGIDDLQGSSAQSVAELEAECAELRIKNAEQLAELERLRGEKEQDDATPPDEDEKKPFACPYCDKSYASQGYLDNHVKDKHPEQLPQ